jgi:hypothetical protein
VSVSVSASVSVSESGVSVSVSAKCVHCIHIVRVRKVKFGIVSCFRLESLCLFLFLFLFLFLWCVWRVYVYTTNGISTLLAAHLAIKFKLL